MPATDSSAKMAAGIRRADQKRRADRPALWTAAVAPVPGGRPRTKPPVPYRKECHLRRSAAAWCSRSSHSLPVSMPRVHRVQPLDRHREFGHVHAGPCPEPLDDLAAHRSALSPDVGRIAQLHGDAHPYFAEQGWAAIGGIAVPSCGVLVALRCRPHRRRHAWCPAAGRYTVGRIGEPAQRLAGHVGSDLHDDMVRDGGRTPLSARNARTTIDVTGHCRQSS